MMDSISLFYLILLSILSLSFFLFKPSPSNTKKAPRPPSPPSLPIIGHLHLIGKPLHHVLHRLSLQYGPVFHLRYGSIPSLVVSTHSAATQCFTTNDVKFATRPLFPSVKSLTYNYSTLTFSPYGPKWRSLRRMATTHLLSLPTVQSLSSVRRSETLNLILSMIREHGNGNEFAAVEMKTKLFEMTFNSMMRMLTGFGGKGTEECRRFREMVDNVMRNGGATNLSDYLGFLRWFDYGSVHKKMKEAVDRREEILQGLIDERREKRRLMGERSCGDNKERKKNSILEVLLDLQEEDPKAYTDETIKSMIVTLFFAGTDTSTVTIEWALSLLLNNPIHLEKAYEEISSQIKEPRPLNEQDLPNLPYLQAIINETFRLCPAAPMLIPHEATDDCVVEGYFVPRGTMLLVNGWAIHRDPKVWEDPLQFKPERFLGEKGAEERAKLIIFGMGRRRCPGEVLAARVVGLTLGSLIQCFEWRRNGDELVDMSESGGATLHKVVSLEALYKPRQDIVDVLENVV